jgi:hypothetical protein
MILPSRSHGTIPWCRGDCEGSAASLRSRTIRSIPSLSDTIGPRNGHDLLTIGTHACPDLSVRFPR